MQHKQQLFPKVMQKNIPSDPHIIPIINDTSRPLSRILSIQNLVGGPEFISE